MNVVKVRCRSKGGPAKFLNASQAFNRVLHTHEFKKELAMKTMERLHPRRR
jgi:hypothetical protein